MKNVHVSLPVSSYFYQVKIGSNILKNCLSDVLFNYNEELIYVVTNKTIHALYPDFIEKYVPAKLKTELLILPDGEKYKNLETLSTIFDFLTEKKANRKSILIAFGGGVIGDMAGFAAASFMRGISLVQVPTTLLSQVDSSIGGKTGVNHPAGKNFIGAFKQPLQTIIDVDFLETLPIREFTAGYAELIKHGIIQDAYLFQILKQHTIEELKQDKELLIDAVFRSCEVKARVVESDEKESNQRAILNFGHTFGHFLETYTNYDQFLHGEAVIVGMDFAAWWSYDQKLLEEDDYLLIHNHLKSLGIKLKIKPVAEETFREIIDHDKKSISGGLRFIGITAIGSFVIFDKVTSESLWNKYQVFLQEDTLLEISE